MKLRYLDLFAGISASTVAWHPLGWEAVAFAQYEPNDNIQFASKVLAHHYPNVPNLGDVTKITEEQIKELGHIDLVVGGSPCQDLSLAGKRRGLKDSNGNLTRSGLFDYQMQIFEWARRNNEARFLLWENVFGALSSNEGNDFAYILGTMVEGDVYKPRDGWKNTGVCVSPSGHRIVEWAVLNSQYFGIPQRRRRIFALLDTGTWGGRPPILSECEGLQWNPEKGKSKRERTTPKTRRDSEKNDRDVISFTTGNFMQILKDVSPTLTRRDSNDPNCVCYAFELGNTTSNGSQINIDVCSTLNSANSKAVAYEDGE